MGEQIRVCEIMGGGLTIGVPIYENKSGQVAASEAATTGIATMMADL